MIYEAVNSLQKHWTFQILLYHSTFRSAPENIRMGLHNVVPDELHRQLAWLKKHFDFVSVDEAVRDARPGTVAVTFDDAYDCVFAEGLPVLESLSIPCTVFVNGNSLAGKAFWRDKIRFLMNRGLVEKFIAFYAEQSADAVQLNPGNFYAMTKTPQFNSRTVDEMINRFLETIGQSFQEMSYCLGDAARIPRGTLLALGNHSFNHYVLSSLTDEEQEQEIRENHEVLSRLGLPVSKIFSVPFGGARDFNDATVRILQKFGYEGFLYSRERINSLRGRQPASLRSAERYMVPSTYPAFHSRLFRLGLNSLRERWSPARP